MYLLILSLYAYNLLAESLGGQKDLQTCLSPVAYTVSITRLRSHVFNKKIIANSFFLSDFCSSRKTLLNMVWVSLLCTVCLLLALCFSFALVLIKAAGSP